MASGIRTSMKIEGLDQLRRNLRDLPINVQTRVLGNAVAKGAKVIADEARARAPVLKEPDDRREPGLLKRMVRATRGVRRDSEAAAFVSVRRLFGKALGRFKEKSGKSGSHGDPWYWKFVEFEFGNSNARAQPFIRPAFDTKKEAAAEEIKRALADGIQREAGKLRK